MRDLTLSAAPPTERARCHQLLDVLEAEAGAVCGSASRIEAACDEMRHAGDPIADPSVTERLARLARIIGSRVATTSAPIVALLCETAATLPDPWPLLDPLLASNDPPVVSIALKTVGEAIRRTPALLDARIIDSFATHSDRENGPLAERPMLESIARILRLPPSEPDTIEELFVGGTGNHVRRMAARLLDLDSSRPSARLAIKVLGRELANWLAPYLAWTRASHLDLHYLACGPRSAILQALEAAEETCGARLLREIIGETGWTRLNFGLTVRRFHGVSVGGSFPLLLSPAEATLLDGVEGKERLFDRFLVVAYGGRTGNASSSKASSIARFRAYNLAHAELLAGFLDVTPLSAEKVRETVGKMDRVVEDFQLLFAASTDECPTLRSIYGELKKRIELELAAESSEPGRPLSAELTRLVEMFEDPQSLTDVRTLHGLKRYLHQRGLKLGMLLAESGHGANRTVTFTLATPEHPVQTAQAIEYVDFESEGGEGEAPPYAVQLVVDEFGRQLVHAEQQLPKIKIFCYGNEVHYFVAYRNHPAFVRIDYSPPGRGGMIDLAYFGVSKFELSSHPAIALPAVERFFRRLDFDVQIDNTHVHARYDKERAFDLADLCQKAASLFRIAPYLMDLDWVIGDLALSTTAKEEVAAAWADFFAEWGVLPCPLFLTSDRCGILAAIDAQPAGEREVRWNGSGPYRDRFRVTPEPNFWSHVAAALEARGIHPVVPVDGEGSVAQLLIESRVLEPLREACERGELVGEDDLRPDTPQRFERRHPAECLASVLQSGSETISRSARLAEVVSKLSRGLRFRTTGAINGYEVQYAALPLPGRTLGIYVLRDASSIFRLAIHGPGDSLYVRRANAAEVWSESWSVEAESLVALLRRANYPTPWVESPAGVEEEETAARIIDLFRHENPHAALPPLPGERVVAGTAASPGRVVGPARLGLANRHPADVDGAIIICPSMSPADGAFLARATGVVSTGGGALSHAGLLALQYGKPALIIPGSWEHSGDNYSLLAYRTLHYDERERSIGGYRVTERHHLRERDETLRDGDLVVLDADDGLLRILGQERDALALDDSLRQLAIASRQLAGAASDAEILVERGRRLRARHQLAKVLGRMADPIIARHAVTELLLRDLGGEAALSPAEQGQLLACLLGNPVSGKIALDAVHILTGTLARRLSADYEHALRLIPTSEFAWETLSLRLDVRTLSAVVAAAWELTAAVGLSIEWQALPEADLDLLTAGRLEELRQRLRDAATSADIARLRHMLDEIGRIDLLLGGGDPGSDRLYATVVANDLQVQRQVASRRILDASAGGIELRSAAGGKAANLAEVQRFGEGAMVPPWFVVTDHAFREALEAPVSDASRSLHVASVRSAVEQALARTDLTNAQKASLVQQAWAAAQLPPDLVEEVRAAARRLTASASDPEQDFIAVRSSATEEDLEAATRAGDFDTFLFVRGEDELIAHLRRAWSGLWSERALHNRAILGSGAYVGGGIIVQRMVNSHASGVLHTVNVAERRLREMVINAGLGLGEGIVSGSVAADRIVISKEGDLQHSELRFRYLTADKRERIVFNSRHGSGTAKVETLYHQRLRPALEYVEICELVRAADRLERAYGYPLDIEFAVEGTALFLLQVRPIPTPLTVWRETLDRWPLSVPNLSSLSGVDDRSLTQEEAP